MKKKLLTLLLTAVCTFSLVACGDDDSKDTDFFANSDLFPEDDATGNSTGNNNVSGNITDPDNPYGLIFYDIDQDDSLFPVQSLGVYAYTPGYNHEYITIEPQSMTYHTREQDYVFSQPEYEIKMEDPYSTSIYKDGKEVVYLSFYFSLSEGRIELIARFPYVDEETMTEHDYYFDCSRIDAINYSPLEYYRDLDDLGPWGVIPHSEELEAHLLNNFTDDYMIQYADFMIVGVPDEASESGTTYYDTLYYKAKCYNEEGYAYNKTITAYVLENEEIAAKYYDVQYAEYGSYDNHEIILDGKMVIQVYDGSYADEEFSTYNTKKQDASEAAVVYGEHCVFSGRTEYYYYYSKPFTADECKEALAIDELIKEMGCLNLKSEDDKYSISISGNGFSPYLGVDDINYETFGHVTPTEVCSIGNYLIGYEHDTWEEEIYIADVILEDGYLNANVYVFDDSEPVTMNNYGEMVKKDFYSFSIKHVYSEW